MEEAWEKRLRVCTSKQHLCKKIKDWEPGTRISKISSISSPYIVPQKREGGDVRPGLC
jgi:hypothetical protein